MWIAASCVALVGFAGVGVMSRLPEVPASVDEALSIANQRHRESLHDREPARGDGIAGAAGPHYVAALRIVQRLMREMQAGLVSWDDARQTFSVTQGKGWRSLAAGELASFRADFAPALAEMQAGAQCRDADNSLTTYEAYLTATLARAEVTMRVAEGRADAAVELWLDLATFLLDADRALFGDWSADEIASLPPQAADQLAAGLDRLDARLCARQFDLVHELGPDILTVRSSSPVDWCWQEVIAAWDHGFDPSARHLAVYEQVIAHADILEPAGATNEARKAQWQLLEEVVAPIASSSSVVTFHLDFTKKGEQGSRHALALLRSLRIGLAARLGRELPVLIDPTTDAPFRVDEDGAFVVVHRTAPVPPDRWVRCP